jgi:hypothetical protein
MAVRFEIVSGVDRVDPVLWNRLCWNAPPMMEWEYLYCLEKSGVLTPERGFRPRHLVAYEGQEVVAIAPMYERLRPWVEFGDGGLLRFLAELTGHSYHVGLMATVPLTPVPAYKVLYGRSRDPRRVYAILSDYIDFICETHGFATSRFYFFVDSAPGVHDVLLQKGYVGIRSEYCLWTNKGYGSFDDFLRTFKSSRRHKIRRELRDIKSRGIRLRMLEGREAPDSLYDRMYDLYITTWRKYMGQDIPPFLNRCFFQMLGERFRHRTIFCTARDDRDLLALAVFYRKKGFLYGRYWGTYSSVPFLHFATCYYHPIRYAIEEGIQVFDPGFGGEHKTYRGFGKAAAQHYIKFYGDEEVRFAHSILGRLSGSTGGVPSHLPR